MFARRRPARSNYSALQEKTEQYCVVMQTLLHPPQIEHHWKSK